MDEIEEDGRWRQKRLYEFVNGYIPGILVNARCNNDGKLLTNGRDTLNILMYTTLYLAKKQGISYNVTAVMAKGYAYILNTYKMLEAIMSTIFVIFNDYYCLDWFMQSIENKNWQLQWSFLI